ncbi:MAG TPA: nickel-responsive transcriptional regulator NikR [Candidatus Tectomicrobia bacterium]|jgi:CopG family nickel-responsive transcriptional regulator
MTELIRFGVAIPADLLGQFDRLIAHKGYGNRSEAIRDLIRDQFVAEATEDDHEIVGTVTVVYNHHVRQLSTRLTALQHQPYGRVIATLHVHLDAEHCLEVAVIRGPSEDIRRIADHLIGTKGVTHGKLTLTSAHPELP